MDPLMNNQIEFLVAVNVKSIGNNIRLLRRKDLSISQEKLAELIEVDTKTICRLENSENTPSLKVLEKLASIFQLKLAFIKVSSSKSSAPIDAIQNRK
jgi:DNA-binding XRE family transcriptional regulator